MKIAVTGATGFLGTYIVARLVEEGHTCRCWVRPTSDRGVLAGYRDRVEWVEGALGDRGAAAELVRGCGAVVHAALDRPGRGFRQAEGDIPDFVATNVVGTLYLIEAARKAEAAPFVYISSCAVHEKILADRPLDETHPTWAGSAYGAHKAAVEQFVYSYGLGDGYPICSLRPTGIYGLAHPPEGSKWFELVQSVAQGHPVDCQRGGKEVHAADVARAVRLLLRADGIAGQVYNCYDRYISDYEVAQIAQRLTGSRSAIRGEATAPQHQIVTEKLRRLGMTFGGLPLLEQTIAQLIAAR